MIAEAAASLGARVKPGAVVVAVGGGGLLCGVVQGLRDVGWTDVPVVAMETVGADCFNAAVKAGRLVTLDDITRSEATGAEMVGHGRANVSVSAQRSQMSRSEDGLPESV